jgi:DNA modification methylase
VLPYRQAKEGEDEKHVHPLQLDVIERACVMWSNPGEVVLTPFAGVGSELVGALMNGRKAVGVELKPAYFNQALKNLREASAAVARGEQQTLFSVPDDDAPDEESPEDES